ncbi:metallopeptidase [Chryseobacterium sp. 6424]|uniref:M23 family metallopeptidase n=1 Tax=Chryseobacterium sp. 6424 TaxID=2039166 RepID=UPI000EFD381D|nr:M23 family metallopeptidase [Chryseobacterium sp. 6424]AYO57975.1 metallopeptidase [Chryseobacterium sp. 6424]
MKRYILIFTLLIQFSLKAQFNTVTFVKKMEESKPEFIENSTEETNSKTEETRVSEKENFFLKNSSKKVLRKELDSLRKMFLEMNKLKTTPPQFDTKHVEDSLIQILKRNLSGEKSGLQKSLKPKEENTLSPNKIMMPVKNALNLSSGFGNRFHPIFGGQKFHNGIDIKARYENVFAVMDGIITESGWDSKGGGNYIKVLHHNRFETAYLHLSEMYYKAGEFVKAGFIIGKSGNTGNSTGPHLHFSVKEFGRFINPLNFLNELIQAKQLIAQHYEH